MQPKPPFIELPHILTSNHLLQIPLQHDQLPILTLVIRQNRYPILQLKYVTIRRIVNQNHLRQLSINYPHIFGIDVLVDLYAIAAV